MKTVRNKTATALTVLLLALAAVQAQAADVPEQQPQVKSQSLFGDAGLKGLAAGIGAGLVVIGGAAGIARIGAGAVDSMARQPEAAGSINTAMIITAAMIEGATLFAVVVCLLVLILKF